MHMTLWPLLLMVRTETVLCFRECLSLTSLPSAVIGWIDLTYIMIPVFISWKLQMSNRRRITLALLAIISLGIVLVIVLKVVTYQNMQADMAATEFTTIIYTSIELNLCIVLGCLPALLALFNQKDRFRWLFKRSTANDLPSDDSGDVHRMSPSGDQGRTVRTIGDIRSRPIDLFRSEGYVEMTKSDHSTVAVSRSDDS